MRAFLTASAIAAILAVSSAVHYEDPNTKAGCQWGEQKIKINGIAGDMCSPACVAPNNTCPTDVPSGVTAKPACLLHSNTGQQFCALQCTPGGPNQCGKNATCKAIQGSGLCTYNDIPPPPSSAHWKPVNSPTFEQLGVVMDVAFSPDGKIGYAGAGSNGVGAQIVKSMDSGVTWKAVWPTNASQPAFNIFLASAVKGEGAVVAGAMFEEYTKDGVTFNTSTNNFFSPAQDAHVMANGDFALVGPVGSNSSGVSVSPDGETWTPISLGVNATLFPSRYGAFPSATTWYVTAGLFPNTNSKKVTHNVAIENNKATFTMDEGDADDSNGPVDCKQDAENCFSASIHKTSDGGKTWSQVYVNINTGDNIYPNGIDCFSETHCVAALEGDTARILMTTDGGATWNETMHDTDSKSSLVAVSMISDTEVWVSGGHMTYSDFEGRFWHSLDGGVTWKKEAIPDLYIVSFDMTSPKSGFACALTITSGVELLKYDATGAEESKPAVMSL